MAINEKNSEFFMPQWLIAAFLVISLIGLTDASYLTVDHYRSLALGCLGIGSCEKVTASAYSTIGQIPVSLLGAFYYAAIFSLALAYLWFSRKKQNKIFGNLNKDVIIGFLARFTIIGFLFSLWFVYLQLFVIKEICIYCMISALTSTILFVLGLLVIRYEKQADLIADDNQVR